MPSEAEYSVETVSVWDRAHEEIRIARENDVDPLDLAETHYQLARVMRHLLKTGEAP